ncbi:MAG: hypothetical protein AAB821_00145 [Patescibacteria group bacterium]
MELLEHNTNQEKKEKLSLNDLPKVLAYLESLGLKSAVMDIADAQRYLERVGHSLPLVRDGGDGIRADYDKRTGQLKVWFTNGFEEPDNPQRQEIEVWLKDNFE